MVIQKSISYLLARGLPGIISLLAIMIYTRLLTPEIYGQYAIVSSLVVLLITMCFQWMQFSILRYYPKEHLNKELLISNLVFTFFAVAIIVLPVFAVFLGLAFDFLSLSLILMVILLTLFHAFFDISIQLPVIRGEALYYGIMLFFKAAMGLAIGVALIYLGYKLEAPLYGLAIAYLILVMLLSRRYLDLFKWQKPDFTLIKSMVFYGMPLSGTFIMNYIIANSDRLMLAWLKGEDSAGLYSAAYDLSNFSLMVIFMSIHLAIYPMIVKAYESEKLQQVQLLLKQNLQVLLLISIVPAVLFSYLVVDVSQLIFGKEFWTTAIDIIPLVTLATFFLGIKAYHFDLAFLLSHKTKYLFFIGLAGAILNIILNYLLIEQYAIQGAAYATCISYFSILVMSFLLGRSIFKIPVPVLQSVKILLVLAASIGALYLLNQYLGDLFIMDLLVLLLVYIAMIYYLNFLDCQSVIKSYIYRK